MNSNTLDPGRDMGKDSRIGYLAQNQKVHLNFAKDVFGFTVNYFEGDYSAIGGSSFEADYSGTALGNYNQDLFNGNIRHVVTAIEGMEIQGYGYKYDQLQRLKEMQVFRDDNLVANNNWSTSQATDDYKTNISYDKNGNIQTLKRNGYAGAQLAMDDMRYGYYTLNGERSNRLNYVREYAQDYSAYEDIKQGQAPENYKYNLIGELTEDVQENMELHWRYGDHKLQKIERTDADSPEVEFFYNPLGVRVGKLVKPRQGGVLEPQENWTMYYYAYDANGQLMSVYDSKIHAQNGETILEEQYIYGMDRIGSIQKGLLVFDNNAIAPSNDPYVENTLGQKRYELKNYLGTVNVTVSDRKTYNSLEDAFEAVVTNYAETYAFGMLMPNRSFNADGQRYGFHGMEQDPELKGAGNSYTTEFRQYDPRLGRWKSLDALMYMFPHMSPYNAFANNPIYFTDPLGLAPEGGGEGNGEPEKTQELPEVTVVAKRKPRVIAQGENEKGVGADFGFRKTPKLPTSDPNYFNNDPSNIYEDIGYNEYIRRRALYYSDKKLLDELYSLGDEFADGEGPKKMVKGIIDHFKSNTGDDYESSDLSEAASNHPSTKRFIKQIREGVRKEITKNKGFTKEVNIQEHLVGHPRFSEIGFLYGLGYGDEDNGLMISVNDVWTYEVKVVDYIEINGFWSAKIELTLYDHFGLNKEDITDHIYADIYHEFYSWFILQWQRGFQPFVTVMKIPTFQVTGIKSW